MTGAAALRRNDAIVRAENAGGDPTAPRILSPTIRRTTTTSRANWRPRRSARAIASLVMRYRPAARRRVSNRIDQLLQDEARAIERRPAISAGQMEAMAGSLRCLSAPDQHADRTASGSVLVLRDAERHASPSRMFPSDIIRAQGEKPMFTRHKDDDPSAGEPALPVGLADAETNRPSDSSNTQAAHRDRLADSGLGVPPFRPAPPKEAPFMASPLFTPVATPVTPAQAAQQPTLAPARTPARDPSERCTLVVGRGISVQGTVQDAERLVVEGIVEASMIHATELAVSPGGMFTVRVRSRGKTPRSPVRSMAR